MVEIMHKHKDNKMRKRSAKNVFTLWKMSASKTERLIFPKKRMIVLVWFALVFVFFVGGDGAFLFCFVDLVKRIQDFKEWHWVLGSRQLMTGHEQRPFPWASI